MNRQVTTTTAVHNNNNLVNGNKRSPAVHIYEGKKRRRDTEASEREIAPQNTVEENTASAAARPNSTSISVISSSVPFPSGSLERHPSKNCRE